MTQAACPRCFGPLVETRVSPCFVCGAWSPEPREGASFTRYRLPSGRILDICVMCHLMEFCSGPSDIATMLGVAEHDLDLVGGVEHYEHDKDKYCERCRCRLALLKLAAGEP